MRYQSDQKTFARTLRKSQTPAETLLWQAIRRETLGARFRRQVAIGRYIVDFACLAKCLVIEVDGGQHAESAYDRLRDAWLESEGFRVVRFWNTEVYQNMEGVLEVVRREIEERG